MPNQFDAPGSGPTLEGPEPGCDHCARPGVVAEYRSKTDSGVYCLECLLDHGEELEDYTRL